MAYRSLKDEIDVLEQGLPPLEDDGFIGGRLDPEEANLVLLPVPWEATVSFREGTANAPDAIRTTSHQLDVETYHYDRPYRGGIAMLETNSSWVSLNNHARKKALKVIEALESGSSDDDALADVNAASEQLRQEVYEASLGWLNNGKFVGLLGGDHSSPLGLIEALDQTLGQEFGILHVDAHHDLREAYEGFTYSHASIFYNVMERCPSVSQLIQIGIRDYSKEEADRVNTYADRARCLYDTQMQQLLAEGNSIEAIFTPLIDRLPKHVYLSIDIDGLEPANCPQTGTPVPGGLRYGELEYLIYMIVKSGRKIIGFDLCEVGISEDGWDENVGARVLYQLSGALLASQNIIPFK